MDIFAVRHFFGICYSNFSGSAADYTTVAGLSAAHGIERCHRQHNVYFLPFFGLCYLLSIYNHACQYSFGSQLFIAHKPGFVQIAQLFFDSKAKSQAVISFLDF